MSKTSVRKDIEKSVEEADDRDIFEKALDVATPLAGAYAGTVIGSKIGKAIARRRSIFKELGETLRKPDSDMEFEWALSERARQAALGQMAGGGIGGLAGLTGGALLTQAPLEKRKKAAERRLREMRSRKR